jgi:hypothetical protein
MNQKIIFQNFSERTITLKQETQSPGWKAQKKPANKINRLFCDYFYKSILQNLLPLH